MIYSKNVLLLTATIDPSKFNTPFTVLMDKQERLTQYTDTINKYLHQENVDAVILCDNTLSNDSFDFTRLIALQNKKEFEYLTFLGNVEFIHKYGKGYGEGEIIKYALHNSNIINNNPEVIYKVTGRIFIENISTIIKNTNCENCFLLSTLKIRNKIDTRFFKVNIQFYKNHLIDEYLNCNDYNNVFLEDVFYKVLKNYKKGHFYSYPKYIGNSGSDGMSYEMSRYKYYIYNLFNRFKGI